jgi:hypothetical protein
MIPASPEAIVFPGGWLQRLWFAWATVAVPILLFSLALVGFRMSSRWQRPDIGVWCELLVDRPAILAFGPLVLLAVVVCGAVAQRPGDWVFSWPCRLVLVAGFLLGLQFALLVPASLLIRSSWSELPGAYSEWGGLLIFIAGVYAAPLAIAKAFEALKRRLPMVLVILACGLFLLALLLGAASLLPSAAAKEAGNPAAGGWTILLLGSVVLTMFGGPVWTAGALGHLLWRLRGAPRLPVAGILAALGAYLVSWRIAVHLAVEAYQALPPTKPTGCFVATAAAQAPTWLTGGFESSPGFRVTPQLQRLKLFEIALKAVCPRGHRSLRRVYDRVGPRLAARIEGPGGAAVAWLALRPCELVATGVLRVVAGRGICRRAACFYRGRQQERSQGSEGRQMLAQGGGSSSSSDRNPG